MGFVDNVKDVVKVAREIDNVELNRKIIDLQTEAISLIEENAKLKKEVQELTEKLAFQGSLKHRDGAYWKSDDDGPFCMPCWDDKHKLMRMNGPDVYHCPTCGYNYITEAHARFIDDEIGRFNQGM